jgi:gamma-glutamylcyclotransferase (GGCT)/AIG2-like uncharacterized protein YtfP
MSGRLYDLGRYPGVFRDSVRERVHGELYGLPGAVSREVLGALDDYEGAEFSRRRVFATLSDGSRRRAWAYVLRRRPSKATRALATGRYERKRGAA